MRTVATRTDYLDAGLSILAREGHGGLKISALCSSFGLTTGSFYGYFHGFEAYVSELLERWELEQTHRIVELAAIPHDPVQRLSAMKRLAITVPHEAESAIRAWSKLRPAVAQAQRAVDRARERALYDAVLGIVENDAKARHLAAMGLSLLIGIQQLRVEVTVEEVSAVLDDFEWLVLAHARQKSA